MAALVSTVRRKKVPSRWHNRDYMILWSGQAVSILGSNMTAITLPLLVLSLTHSALQADIVGAIFGLPYPILGLLAGALVDRVDRRRSSRRL